MPLETSPYARLDRAWLLIFMIVGSALSTVLAESTFDLSVFISGLLCVSLLAIGRREGYLFGLYSSLTYSVLAYGNGLYGEMYLNLLFFVPTGIVGYVMWRQHVAPSKSVAMQQLNWPRRALIVVVCIVSTLVLGLVLGMNPNQNTPFIDAATNVLSIIATLLMMWRYKEQWLLYIALNIVTISMWFMRVQEGGEAGGLMVLMWSLFLLNALFGYWRWHMGAKGAAPATALDSDGVTVCGAV